MCMILSFPRLSLLCSGCSLRRLLFKLLSFRLLLRLKVLLLLGIVLGSWRKSDSELLFSRMYSTSSERFYDIILSASSMTTHESRYNERCLFSTIYFIRPGVPMITSAPFQSPMDWISSCFPPTNRIDWRLSPWEILMNSSSICSASSREGARMRA